jgi:DNA polymerase-3 subunit beta
MIVGQSITLDRKELAEALSLVKTVVSHNAQKPILQNVLIEVSGGKCTVTGSDAETIVSCEIACDDESNGRAVLLSCNRLSSIVGSSLAEKIHLSSDGKIACGSSRFAMQTMDAAEFPRLDDFEPEIRIQGLSAAVTQVAFATDAGSTRFALSAVHIRLDEKPDYLIVEATDSRRLAVHGLTATLPKGFSFPSPVLIPPRPAKLIAAIGDDSHFACKFSENAFSFQCGSVRVKSRLVEGRFPRTQDVIPDTIAVTAGCVSETLAMAANQASIVNQKDDADSFGADFEFTENQLTIRSRGQDIGAADIELPIVYSDSPIKLRLNPQFLLDGLRHIQGPVSFRINDPDSPVMLTNDDSYRYIVMPLGERS